MATLRDKQIQDLFKIIQIKKAEIAKAERPNWKTNSSFAFNDGSSNRINIQTISKVEDLVEMLSFLLEKKHFRDLAAEELGIKKFEFKWLGFSFEDWKSDFQTRATKIQIIEKKKELDVMENTLNNSISPELKAELEDKKKQEELDEIAKILLNN